MRFGANVVGKEPVGPIGCKPIFCRVVAGEGKVGVKDMDDRKELFAAVAAAASSAAPGEGGDGGTAERYESLLAYVKRHASR